MRRDQPAIRLGGPPLGTASPPFGTKRARETLIFLRGDRGFSFWALGGGEAK